MAIRLQRSSVVTKDGQAYEVTFVENPLIDDVLTAEIKVQAYLVSQGTTAPDRRVDRTIRDFLVRLGVER